MSPNATPDSVEQPVELDRPFVVRLRLEQALKAFLGLDLHSVDTRDVTGGQEDLSATVPELTTTRHDRLGSEPAGAGNRA